LRYRRPARIQRRLGLRARLVRVEGRDYFVQGEIVDESGAVLTEADARWRRIDTRPG
jgi:acyl-CoA thioesterase FadM